MNENRQTKKKMELSLFSLECLNISRKQDLWLSKWKFWVFMLNKDISGLLVSSLTVKIIIIKFL